MPPLPAPARLAARAAVALALLAGAAVAAPARPAPPAAPPAAPAPAASDPAGDRAALSAAQDRAARAAAAIDDLKRELAPAHLTDPMPEVDRAFGLSSLRSDYADAQRRAAGYRATLGDQHPTLVATEQVMENLRAQLLAGTRRALAAAERDAVEARADVAAAERRLAGAVAGPREGDRADVTGTTAAPAARHLPSPLSLPAADATPVVAARAGPATVAAAPPSPPVRHPLRTLALAAAALILAVLSAAWAALRLLRPRPPRAFPEPLRRIEPALAGPPLPQPAPTPEPIRPAAPAGVPVLGRVSLQAQAAPPAEAMAGLHATLRAAFGQDAARMTVLVAPAADLPVGDADAAASALALSAAAAGRRPLLMEARARGRLRAALAPAGALPTAIEAGGAVRTLYRLGPEGAGVALLPSDPGEAEAAASAAARPGAARLRGLDAFDTVILVGDDPAALASSADLLLLAAPTGASPSTLAAAARALDGGTRPCGAVLVEPSPAPRASPLPRRRSAPETPPSARLGLRGTLAPSRRRAG